jgi:hypothetical protein
MAPEKRGWGVRGGDARRQRGGARGGVTQANQMKFLIDHAAELEEAENNSGASTSSTTTSFDEDDIQESLSPGKQYGTSPGGDLPKFRRIDHSNEMVKFPAPVRKKVAEGIAVEIATSWEQAQRAAKEARAAAKAKAKADKAQARRKAKEDKAQAAREAQLENLEKIHQAAKRLEDDAAELRALDEAEVKRRELGEQAVALKDSEPVDETAQKIEHFGSSFVDVDDVKDKPSGLVGSSAGMPAGHHNSTRSGPNSLEREMFGFVGSRSMAETIVDDQGSGMVPPPIWESQRLEALKPNQIYPEVSEHSADSGEVSLFRYTWGAAADKKVASMRVDTYNIFASEPGGTHPEGNEGWQYPAYPPGRVTPLGKYERDITKDPRRLGRRCAVLAPLKRKVPKKERIKAPGRYRQVPESGKAVLYDPHAPDIEEGAFNRVIGSSLYIGGIPEAESEHPRGLGESEMESEFLLERPVQLPGTAPKGHNGRKQHLEGRRDPHVEILGPEPEPELTADEYFDKLAADTRRVQYSIETLKWEAEQAKPRLDAYLASIEGLTIEQIQRDGKGERIVDMAATAPPGCSLLQYDHFHAGINEEYGKAFKVKARENKRRMEAAHERSEVLRLKKQEEIAAVELKARLTPAEKKEEMERLKKDAIKNRIRRDRQQRKDDEKERLRVEIACQEPKSKREETLEFLKTNRKGGLEGYELHELNMLVKLREVKTRENKAAAMKDFKAKLRKKYRDQAAAARLALETEEYGEKEPYVIPYNSFTRKFSSVYYEAKSTLKGRRMRRIRASVRETGAVINDAYLEGSKEVRSRYGRYVEKPMRRRVLKQLRRVRGVESDPRFAQDNLDQRRTPYLLGSLMLGGVKKVFFGSAGAMTNSATSSAWEEAQRDGIGSEEEAEETPNRRSGSPPTMFDTVTSAMDGASSKWAKLKFNMKDVASRMSPTVEDESQDPEPFPGRVQQEQEGDADDFGGGDAREASGASGEAEEKAHYVPEWKRSGTSLGSLKVLYLRPDQQLKPEEEEGGGGGGGGGGGCGDGGGGRRNISPTRSMLDGMETMKDKVLSLEVPSKDSVASTGKQTIAGAKEKWQKLRQSIAEQRTSPTRAVMNGVESMKEKVRTFEVPSKETIATTRRQTIAGAQANWSKIQSSLRRQNTATVAASASAVVSSGWSKVRSAVALAKVLVAEVEESDAGAGTDGTLRPDLPYGGDVNKAAANNDRSAIRIIMAARGSPKPNESTEEEPSDGLRGARIQDTQPTTAAQETRQDDNGRGENQDMVNQQDKNENDQDQEDQGGQAEVEAEAKREVEVEVEVEAKMVEEADAETAAALDPAPV